MSWRALLSEHLETDAEAIDEAVVARLDALFAEGRAAHAELPADADAFARFVACHLDPQAPLLAQLAPMRAADVYLAASCAAWHDAALAAFEQIHWSSLRAALGGRGLSASELDEAMQRLREHLFVTRPGRDGRPRAAAIVSYNGRHPLQAWLRVVAMRVGLQLLRKQSRRRERDDERLQRALSPAGDPEARYLKRRSQAELAAILGEVLAGLAPRDRTLLRQYYVHGLTFREMARIYDVDPSRPRRWVARVREAVREQARALVMERLRLSPTECESLVRLVDSELHLSISRVLPSQDPASGDESR